MKNLVLITCAAALLAACASPPPRSDRLEQARADIQTLAQDPLTQQAASKDLEAARQRLQQADTAVQEKRPIAEIEHLAYLAQRDAEAGEARIAEARARQQVARADEQRSRVLLEERAQEAQAAKAQLAASQAELAQLKARQTDRGTVVTLGDVLFDTGRASLKPGADLTLDRLATLMKENPQARVLIEGHTDNRGSEEYNEALSQRRADAVAAALLSRGVPTDAVHAIGRGKEYPVATNDTPEGRQQNRRVEIIFSDASGRFAQSAVTNPTLR
jgi:OmpA-OmpF porin, OOP family